MCKANHIYPNVLLYSHLIPVEEGQERMAIRSKVRPVPELLLIISQKTAEKKIRKAAAVAYGYHLCT